MIFMSSISLVSKGVFIYKPGAAQMLARNHQNQLSTVSQMNSKSQRNTANPQNMKISAMEGIRISQCPESNTR